MQRLALRPMACAVMLSWTAGAVANPTGAQVAAGSAAFNTTGKTFTVTNTPGAILNWQSFSIGPGEITRFQQQSALSAVLNRVTGANPSSILGTLSSNGRVFLVNPHGIVFGQGSVINTAGFVASTLNISDADFLAGRMKFEGGGNGVLRNEGVIHSGGDIFLVGPQIENAGLIRSDNGSVLLAAGQSVTITSPDAHGVQFALQAPTDSALNLGVIEAKNAAGMFAGTLRHSGDIRVLSASVDDAGRVILAAQKDAILDGSATINVDNALGRGGSVQITGERVGLFDAATVSARGAAGGGEILVGGDYKGGNPEVRNARMTYVSPMATLDASATANGDGGRIIVWADDSTRVHGNVFACGGPQGGAGGFIETSGKRFLDVAGINLSASGDVAGMWLLDPYNVTVVAGAGTSNNGGAPGFVASGDDSQIGADLIVTQLNSGTGVTISTSGAGTQAGNITIDAPIVKTVNNSAGMILNADGDITINQDITLTTPSLGANAGFTANAGGAFAINNATVSAYNILVTADSISRSGAQATDFSYSQNISGGGMFRLTTNTGAVGSVAEPIRFTDTQGSHNWAVDTSAAGAAGDIYVRYTGTGGASGTNSLFHQSNNIITDGASAQTVSIRNDAADYGFNANVSNNDHWLINAAGNWAFSYGAKLTAASITATIAGDITYFNTGGNTVAPLTLDTSAVNGPITLTAGAFTGTPCGGNNWGVGVAPGSGIVTATSVANPAICGGSSGSLQFRHFGGDLLSSRYNLSFTGANAGNNIRLWANDGHIIFDSTAGFNANLDDKNWEVRTATAGKDIRFAGGTITGNRMYLFSTGNIDNLAPGVTGWREICATGNCSWKMEAGGGIGLTNPIRAEADWVGNLQTAAAGAAGNINVAFVQAAGAVRPAGLVTDTGSAQSISITGTSVELDAGQPGWPSANYITANDNLSINVSGNLTFGNWNTTPGFASATLVSGGDIKRNPGGGSNYLMTTTGALDITAGGTVGESGNYVLIPSAGSLTINAGSNIYLDAGANPLSASGLSTGAGVGTIGLRNSGANDITIGGSTSINDNLIINAGQNILFPAAANFSTSGGLALNSPTQIAATASVAVTGGTFSASSTINNAGTLTKANSGTTTFGGAFTNSGTLNVNTGTLNMGAGMTQTAGGISIGSGATLGLPFGTTSTWSGGTLTQAGLSSTLRLDDATLTLNSNISNSGTLHLQNFATLNGSGTVTNTGDVNIYGLLGSPTPVVFAANLVNQGNMQTRDAARINGSFSNAAGGTFLNNDSDTIVANGFTNAGTLLLYSDAAFEPMPTLTVTSGTLVNTGTISTIGSVVRDRVIAATFDNRGTVTTSVGRLVINKSGAAQVNSGTMNATGADILVQQGGGGSFTHSAGTINAGSGRSFGTPGGVFDWQGGTLDGPGSFNPSGGMSFSGSGARVLNGPTLNLGATTLSAGSLLLQSGALNFGGIATIGPSATLELTGGTVTGALAVDVQGLLKMNGGVLNAATLGLVPGGVLSGNGGTINAPVVNGGTVAVGASPGTLVINGNYAQTPTGVLNVELGGTTQGVNYDLLQVTGSAALDGTLNVALFGGFTGAAGNVFDVLTYSSRTGDFATVNFPAGYTMTATPNAALYQLAINSIAVPPVVLLPGSGAFDAQIVVPASEVKILNDKFLATVDTGKQQGEDEKKGAVLECK